MSLTHQVRKITTCTFLDGAGRGLAFYVTNRADYRSHSDITSFDDAIAASEQAVNFPVSNWPIKEVISQEAGLKRVGEVGGRREPNNSKLVVFRPNKLGLLPGTEHQNEFIKCGNSHDGALLKATCSHKPLNC